jgi:hypothetical protein
MAIEANQSSTEDGANDIFKHTFVDVLEEEKPKPLINLNSAESNQVKTQE